MTKPPSSSGDAASGRFDPLQETLALATEVSRIVAIAQTMQASGRPVDLAGLDRSIGLLCAKALDLSPEQGRQVRLELAGLAERIEALRQAIRAQV